MPFLTRGSFSLHYEIHENLVETPLLLIHGNLACNAWWKPALHLWKKQSSGRHPVICAEWRGCGESNRLSDATPFSLEALADDYIALLSTLRVSSANVIGHSTGGVIAVFAMSRAPSMFTRAVLLDPVGARGVVFTPEKRRAFLEMSKDPRFCEIAIRATIQGEVEEELLGEVARGASQAHPLVFTEIPRLLHNCDYRPLLSRLLQPILVLHGEFDPVLPVEPSRELASSLPQGRFELLPGRGHSANLEAPELFVKTVDKFLSAPVPK